MRYILVILLLAGCSSPQLEHVSEPLVVVSHDDQNYWINVKNVAPTYPFGMTDYKQFSCVNVSYIINSDGSVSNPEVVKSVPTRGFERASIRAILKFIYEPSPSNLERVPVRTNKIFTYVIVDSISELDGYEGLEHELCGID